MRLLVLFIFLFIALLIWITTSMARDGQYYPPPDYSPAPEVGDGDMDAFYRTPEGQSAKKLMELLAKGDYEGARRHYEIDKKRFNLKPGGEAPVRKKQEPTGPITGPGMAPAWMLR